MSFFLYTAPMQGHTDAAYRHFHTEVYGEADAYFTPFLRVERGDCRPRDIKNLVSPLNDNHLLIPQIIFRSESEFDLLVDTIIETGAQEIDLNLGCPYPMQTHHGRGAALIANVDLMSRIFERVNSMEDISFSVKMRAGLNDKDEWHKILPLINDTRLAHVTFHPRIASQKYSGELLMDEFEQFLAACSHPVIYNGDLTGPEQIISLRDRYEDLAGCMVGRGLLARPSLFNEIKAGQEMPQEERIEMMLSFHDRLKAYYSEHLCGDAQLLEKMKTFWEYAQEEIGRKPWKAIKKATSMAKYDTAVSSI